MQISPVVGCSQAQQVSPRSLVDLSSFAGYQELTVTFIRRRVGDRRDLATRRVRVKCEGQPANTCWENAREIIFRAHSLSLC